MSKRVNIPARSSWASVLAYSRAVAVNGHVAVSGTLPVDADGNLVGGTDAYLQARHVFAIILQALGEAGATPVDVVRIRIYLQDYADFEAIARAQFEAFEQVRPACTVLRVGLVRQEYRVQVDADAIIGERPGQSGTRTNGRTGRTKRSTPKGGMPAIP